MLRELEKGEKVLVICGYDVKHKEGRIHYYPVGSIITYSSGNSFEFEGGSQHIGRHQVLAIGDKVVRGPDIKKDANILDSREGQLGEVISFDGSGDRLVRVKWDKDVSTGRSGHYRMTPDHQDLKPTGDSVDTGDSEAREDGKPKCFGEYLCTGLGDCKQCSRYVFSVDGTCPCVSGGDSKCTYARECKAEYRGVLDETLKPIKEEVMTREQRAKDLEKTKQEAIDAKQTAIEKHEEDLAQRDESIADLTAKAAELRAYKTDKAAKNAKVIAAKNLDSKTSPEDQAEAIIWCADNDIDI